MGNIRIESVAAQFGAPDLLASLLTLYTRADAMGLLPQKTISEVTPATLRLVLGAFRALGLLGTRQPRLEPLLRSSGGPSTPPPADALSALAEMLAAIDESPAPEKEWPAMRQVFGDDDLARLLGISASSLKRYASGSRVTPDEIADRVHWLAMVVAALSGSYNEVGIRRWFERPRAQLQGSSPRRSLGSTWSSLTPNAQRVRALAESLVSSGGT